MSTETILPIMSTGGIPRIETIGAIVRGEYGNLARIIGVYENSRCSARHVSVPLDVVVELEPIGPGFNHRSSWASKLTAAQPGDIGAHPHAAGCPCGAPHDGGAWRYVPASWV